MRGGRRKGGGEEGIGIYTIRGFCALWLGLLSLHIPKKHM